MTAGPMQPWTWHIMEVFKVEDGLLHEIEAVLERAPYGMTSGWSSWEDGMSDRIQFEIGQVGQVGGVGQSGMDQRIRRLITMGAVALVCLVLVTAPGAGAAARSAAGRLQSRSALTASVTLHLEGFGATYAETGRRVPLDLVPSRHRRHARRDDHAAGLPQGGTRANGPRSGPCRRAAEVSFTAGGQAFVGLINARDEVDRVQTWVDDQGPGDALVETLFRDYEKTPSGVSFPTHITQSHGGYPSLDVWLSAVSASTRSKRPREADP